MKKIITASDTATKQFGKQFTARLQGGDIVCLYGELGAGKTTLVKGIAEGLGIKEEITSPTFTLMNIYKILNLKSTILNLVHIDTYRLKDEKELLEIGVEDYLGQPEMVTVVEWPEKIKNLLKNKTVINIYLDHGSGDERSITVE